MLAGFTLGACIALQYGLDYPEEVKGLVLMTVVPHAGAPAPFPSPSSFLLETRNHGHGALSYFS